MPGRKILQNQSEIHQLNHPSILQQKTVHKSDIGVVTVAENGMIVKKRLQANLDESSSINPDEIIEGQPNLALQEENKILQTKNQRYKLRLQKLNTLLKSNEDFIKMLQEEMLQVHNENRLLANQIRGKNQSSVKENWASNANREIQTLPNFRSTYTEALENQNRLIHTKGLASEDNLREKLDYMVKGESDYDQQSGDILRALERAEQLESKRQVLKESNSIKNASGKLSQYSQGLGYLQLNELNDNMSDGSSLPSYLQGVNSRASIT